MPGLEVTVHRGVLRSAACALMLLVPAAALADDFSDFRIPSNRTLLWDARLSTLAHGDDSNRPGLESSTSELNGAASTRFQWLSDSDPVFTSITASFDAGGNRTHSTSDAQLFAPTQTSLATAEGGNRSMSERWGLGFSHRRYPWAMPIGFEVGAAGLGDYSQSWSSNDSDALDVVPGFATRSISSASSETWRYLTVVQGDVSAGWGRVRNATGIYDALVLEQRIRATGALTRPLSPAARQRLAELLYARGNLDTARERPGRSLWGEVERILREDGALGEDGVDPYSVLRGEEPHIGESLDLTADGIPVSPVTRRTGGFLAARLSGSSAHSVERQDDAASSVTITNGVPAPPVDVTSSAHRSDSSDGVNAGLSGEYYRPLGIPWQLDAFGVAVTGLRAEDNYLSYDTQVALAWLVADRWTVTANGRYFGWDDVRTTGPTSGDRWNFNAGVSVIYYLEDRVAIQLTGSQLQQWNRGDASAPPFSSDSHRFARLLDAQLGLTYRFFGWFTMPGFFPGVAAGPR